MRDDDLEWRAKHAANIGRRLRWGLVLYNSYEPTNTILFEGPITEDRIIKADIVRCGAFFSDGPYYCRAEAKNRNDLSAGFAWTAGERSGEERTMDQCMAHFSALVTHPDHCEDIEQEIVPIGEECLPYDEAEAKAYLKAVLAEPDPYGGLPF